MLLQVCTGHSNRSCGQKCRKILASGSADVIEMGHTLSVIAKASKWLMLQAFQRFGIN